MSNVGQIPSSHIALSAGGCKCAFGRTPRVIRCHGKVARPGGASAKTVGNIRRTPAPSDGGFGVNARACDSVYICAYMTPVFAQESAFCAFRCSLPKWLSSSEECIPQTRKSCPGMRQREGETNTLPLLYFQGKSDT